MTEKRLVSQTKIKNIVENLRNKINLRLKTRHLAIINGNKTLI